jgi:hypothetical protein
VQVNKIVFARKFSDFIAHPEEHQPLLCTYVSTSIKSSSGRSVLYEPRDTSTGSIVSHLGEAHLGKLASGAIVSDLVSVD